MQDSLQIKESN